MRNDNRIPWWLWPNVLNLDAPIITAAWQELFARSAGLSVTAAERAALFLAVWVIYAADRLLDGVRLGVRASSSARHQFSHRHARPLALLLLTAIAVEGWLVLARLPREILFGGLALGALVGAYFLWNQLAGTRWGRGWLKELVVSLVFAFGAGLVPLLARPTGEVIIDILSFAAVCMANCLLIARLERAMDEARGEVSIAAHFPRHARPARLLSSVVTAVMVLLLIFGAGSCVPLAVIIAALLMVLVVRFESRWGAELAMVGADFALAAGGVAGILICAAGQAHAAPVAEEPIRGTTYYLDGGAGDDEAAGTSEGAAWRTLGPLNRRELAPGDAVLFRAGTSYSGRLAPKGSGSERAPIRIGTFGEGPMPRIDAGGDFPEALLVENVEYYEIEDLELTNTGDTRARGRAGVRIRADDFGVMRHIVLKRLFVHDVNGDLEKGDGDRLAGFGIQWVNKGRETPSRFDDLLIENCRLARTDRNGICGASAFHDRRRWFPSTRVVIRGNRLEDIGGDGIVPLGCDGAIVEHNTIRGARMRAPDYCAGIWPWSCDDTVIQFNEVSGVSGTLDGQAFDSDYNCRNTIIQYNYSHDNDGGFVLICNNGGARAPGSVGNTGTIIRYNISRNDGERLVQLGGRCEDTRIYNNVFFVGEGRALLGILQGNWGGSNEPGDIVFENNIFWVGGKLTDRIEDGAPPTFRNNLIFGDYQTAADEEDTLRTDPKFVGPGRGADGYQLGPDSPALGAGRLISENGGRDYWGNPVAGDRPPAIGAHEPIGDSGTRQDH